MPIGNDGIKNLMDWKFGPDGSLYVLDYGRGFFTSDAKSALWRVTYTGGGPTPAVGDLVGRRQRSECEQSRRRRQLWTALLASLFMLLGLTSAAAARTRAEPAAAPGAAAQVLTWTAGDDITKYVSAPATAVAGATTIVFENSAATGNTMGMPHTLTFDVSDPEYNNDVPLNILANPNDDQGGKHTAEVTLTPGRYRYYCTIPGHGQMQGILVVTEGGGARHHGPGDLGEGRRRRRTSHGAVRRFGDAWRSARPTRARASTRIEYAIGADGAWQPYTTPVVVDQVGTHTVRYRAIDKAGNAAAEKSVDVHGGRAADGRHDAAGDLGDGER